jgi:pimeloyl-ACP methyl ester carboxylesterase
LVIIALEFATASSAMAGQTVSGTLTLCHGPVQYELSKVDRPVGTVVLVGGFAVPMSVWNDTVPALKAKSFSVLRFDLYGRGGSARPRVVYNVDLTCSPTSCTSC